MVDIKKRFFFRSIIGHIVVAVDEFRGIRHISLNDLHTLPKHVVHALVPVNFEQTAYRVSNNKILDQSMGTAETSVYRELTPEEAYAANHFHMGLTLKAIAKKTAVRFSMDPDFAWSIVSQLFFELARLRVCHPRKMEPDRNNQ